jgi:hypothetical protein
MKDVFNTLSWFFWVCVVISLAAGIVVGLFVVRVDPTGVKAVISEECRCDPRVDTKPPVDERDFLRLCTVQVLIRHDDGERRWVDTLVGCKP